MSLPKRVELQRKARQLEEPVRNARALAEKLGLDGYPVKYWIVDYDEMNELIAYDGFQTRYPHWRWGMKYDRQQKRDRHGMGRAFEIVINDDPAHAYLQESNSSADQKAVVTHVEAHADFFKHNRWYRLFGETVDAAAMFERHGRRIREYMDDPEIGRETVEAFIDSVLTIEDTIDQHRPFEVDPRDEDAPDSEAADLLADLDLSEDVKREVFDDDWIDRVEAERETDDEPERDVLAFLRRHGKQFDPETGKAEPMADWQLDVLDMLRAEAYYLAPQRMTKIGNEGWAAYWESIMMGEEAFAGDDEFLQYADHQARVLGSPGLNPYKLGKQLWEYIENRTNREEVIDHVLRVEGITWRDYHDAVDFDALTRLLEPPAPLDSITPETLSDLRSLPDELVDGEALHRALEGEIDVTEHPWKVLSVAGLARRHYSLIKPQFRNVLREVRRDDLESIARYQFDDDRYPDLETAIEHVDFTAGWNKLFAVRESHNDVTFLDEFLTPEFIRGHDYFTYEYSHATEDFRVASEDPADVKKKLLLQFTNFGKPTVTVADGNYRNRNELLLAHHYNGIALDVDEAADALERVFDLWGRPVNLKTIVKTVDERDAEIARRRGREPDPDETGKLLRYDGEALEIEDLPPEAVEDIQADDIDYGTKPDDWLQ